jgi:hypothetical protein
MLTADSPFSDRNADQIPLHLINFSGYKAGSELIQTTLPADVCEKGCVNIRLN